MNNNYVDVARKRVLSEQRLRPEITRMHNRVFRGIRGLIVDFYEDYAEDGKVSKQESRKRLSRSEQVALRKTLSVFRELAEERKLVWRTRRNLRRLKTNISRYKALETNIDMLLFDLSREEEILFLNHLKRVIKNSYSENVKLIAHQSNAPLQDERIEEEQIDEILAYVFHGMNWRDRIWKNKMNVLHSDLRRAIELGLMQGYTESEIIYQLRERLEKGERRAFGLITSESCLMFMLAFLWAADKYKKKRFRYLNDLESNVCEACLALHNTILTRREIRPGENAPSMHPRCACILAAEP